MNNAFNYNATIRHPLIRYFNLERDRAKARIVKMEAHIRIIQKSCFHIPMYVDLAYGGDSGNWAPTDDCNWTDYHCTVCDAEWKITKNNRGEIIFDGTPK